MATEVERFITALTARAVKLGYAAKVHDAPAVVNTRLPGRGRRDRYPRWPSMSFTRSSRRLSTSVAGPTSTSFMAQWSAADAW